MNQALSSLSLRAYRKVKSTLFPVSLSSLKGLSDIREKFNDMSFRTPCSQITGWMTESEQKFLFVLGAYSNGDVLEIGPWLGRSTVCIANGIVDSKKKGRRFVTCELAPTMENYREIEGGQIGFFYPATSEILLGSMPRDAFDKEKRPYLEHKDGFIHYLRQNLKQAGVDQLVEIVIGSFHDSPEHAYSLVFADVTHSVAEIELHAEHLRKRLAPGGILACHDTSPQNAACLRKLFDFEAEMQIDSLFAGQLQK